MSGVYERVPLDDPSPATRVVLHPVAGGDLPPAYPAHVVAVPLPSYADSERSKALEARCDAVDPSPRRLGVGLTVSGLPLGDDIGFLTTFLISFFLNWLGYLICFCFSRSIAAHAGALSGVGLNLVKTGAIFKYLHDSGNYDDFFNRFGDYVPVYREWLVWVFIVLGSLLFLRGVFGYSRAKRMARREHGF